MKVLAASLLVGAASAAIVQQPLQLPQSFPEKAKTALSLDALNNVLKGLTSEAAAIWDEVASIYPEDMSKAAFFSSPKKHVRKPDHEWDHIIRGQDVQSVWVGNTDGVKEGEIDGKLESYDLRTKKVDPGVLGVDPGVKQYSGYLDDNENDKHLFYCRFASVRGSITTDTCSLRVLRISK